MHCAEDQVTYISTMLLFCFNSCHQASSATAVMPNQFTKAHKTFIRQEAPYCFQLIQTGMSVFEQEDHVNIQERKLSNFTKKTCSCETTRSLSQRQSKAYLLHHCRQHRIQVNQSLVTNKIGQKLITIINIHY